MAFLSPKKLGIILFLIWGFTFCYIWLPGIMPDFLHLRSKITKGKGSAEELSKLSILFYNHSEEVHPSVLIQDGVHVVIASDSNTLGGMIALINSIISNTKAKVKFHLITDEESKEHLVAWLTKTKLKDIKYEIKVFPKEWVTGKIKVRGGRPELAAPLNYARYYLPQLFPNISSRIVYIDDDCIVQGDIQNLYKMKIRPGHLAAFSEDCTGINKRITFQQNVFADFIDVKNKHFKELKIDPTACAFNTGVFVANLSDWRNHNITSQLEYWLELNTREELYGNEKGGGGSQPPMMLVFYGKYTPIDLMWHVHYLGWTARSSHTGETIRNAKLLHWNGHFKPWGSKAAFQRIWDSYFIPDPTRKFHPVRKVII